MNITFLITKPSMLLYYEHIGRIVHMDKKSWFTY